MFLPSVYQLQVITRFSPSSHFFQSLGIFLLSLSLLLYHVPLLRRAALHIANPVYSCLHDLATSPALCLAASTVAAWIIPRLAVILDVFVGSSRRAYRHIPGMPSVPLFGAGWAYWSWGGGPYANFKGKYHEAVADMYKKFGPVVREEVQCQYVLVHLFEKADILKVLQEKSDFPLRPPNTADIYYRKLRNDFYPDMGIVNENGPEWHRLRALLTPPLTNKNTTRNYNSHMNDIAEDFTDLVEHRRSESEGAVIEDFPHLIYRAGLETVSNLALDRRMGFLDQEVNKDTELIIESIQGYQTASNQAMYGFPWWQYVPAGFSPVVVELVRHKDNLCRTIGALVDESLQPGNQDGDESSILQQLNKNKKLGKQDVKSSVTDYITAGVDTIGNSIIFAMALIAKNPRVQKKLQQELDEVLVRGENITDETLAQGLKYLKACVQESFRIYPTASQLARITNGPIRTESGHDLPANSIVLCHQRIASLQEENFTDAMTYAPERWLDSEAYPVCSPELVLPFGFGKRQCPGSRLAKQEIHIIVAKTFQKYNVELVGDLSVEFNWLLTPGSDLKVKVSDRH